MTPPGGNESVIVGGKPAGVEAGVVRLQEPTAAEDVHDRLLHVPDPPLVVLPVRQVGGLRRIVADFVQLQRSTKSVLLV